MPLTGTFDLSRKKKTTTELPEVSISEDGDVRHLHLGTPWIQGSMRIDDPFAIELEYVQRMMAWLLFVPPEEVARRRALQLGLGPGPSPSSAISCCAWTPPPSS